jgi:hypothetical protein
MEPRPKRALQPLRINRPVHHRPTDSSLSPVPDAVPARLVAPDGQHQAESTDVLAARNRLRSAFAEIAAVMEGQFTHKDGCDLRQTCSCGLTGYKRYLGIKG